jgi:4-amino-4-deoxy-L-arabinose transferase-like glycosyltransferase
LDYAQQNTPLHTLFYSPESYASFSHFLKELGDYIRYSFFIYPPLPPLSYALTYFIFGLNSHLELSINILYLITGLWAIYGLGRRIFDERAGFLAAFVFATFPGIIVKTRHICCEFMLACLIPLVFLFLLQTDFFRNRKYSILFGASLGVMALAKWEFPLTFLAPFILYLFYSFFSLRETTLKSSGMVLPFANLLLSIFIATIIALPWYGVAIPDIYYRIFGGEEKVLLSHNFGIFWNWLIQQISFYLLELDTLFLFHRIYFKRSISDI